MPPSWSSAWPIASSSKPASTSMTIASAAFAAMCLPSTGTDVRRVRPSGPVRANDEPSADSSRNSIRHSASVLSSDVIVVTGMREASTTRMPHALSSDTTARLACSGSKSGSFAAKYSSMSS